MKKINQLLRIWPKGTIKTVKELEQLGYRPELLQIYKKYNWIEQISRGAYKLGGDEVSWEGGLFALHHQKETTIHPGGRTALLLKGYAHNIPMHQVRIDLFGNPGDQLPKWFKSQKWMEYIKYISTNLFDYGKVNALTLHETRMLGYKISTMELAAMEMLNLIPKGQSFDEAMKIMEGLTTLRPGLVQHLLEVCNSVKVKRIFLFMAEQSNHAWIKKLNLEHDKFR